MVYSSRVGPTWKRTAAINVLALDKTGTLTYGKPKLTNIHALNSYSKEAVVRIAAGAESLSEHPIALAILTAARAMNLEIEEPDEFRAIAGHGVQAVYNRETHTEIIYIGNDKLFMDESMDISPAIRMIGRALQRQGKTTMLVARRSTVEDTLGEDWIWRWWVTWPWPIPCGTMPRMQLLPCVRWVSHA